MKLLTAILSLIILSLTVIPCTDSDTCDNDNTEQTSHSHNEDEGDLCTPFCMCTCCGGLVVFTFHTSPQLLNLLVQNESITYFQAFSLSRMSRTIWLPPKV